MGEGRNAVTAVRLRFANRTYTADDHITGAALSPLPLGDGRVRGEGAKNEVNCTAAIYLPKGVMRCAYYTLHPTHTRQDVIA